MKHFYLLLVLPSNESSIELLFISISLNDKGEVENKNLFSSFLQESGSKKVEFFL